MIASLLPNLGFEYHANFMCNSCTITSPTNIQIIYQIKIPSPFPSLSWSNATSKMGKSDTKPLRLFSSRCSPLQQVHEAQKLEPKNEP